VNYRLTLAGSDPVKDASSFLHESLASQIDAGRVRILQRRSAAETRQLVAQHDCFILLSEFEGMPLSLVEAMGAGCVPVTTDIKSGVPELIRNEGNGFIVPERDWDMFAAILRQLANNPEMLHRMSVEATATIARGMTAREMIESFDRLLVEVSDEIASGAWKRPKTLTARSPLGDVLIPPSMIGASNVW
jgi:glycosyltransferase involved in cell wall biosynthesis